MIRGLYIANTGMNVQAKRMDIISNDLANVNTTGYKQDTVVVGSFQEVMLNRINDMEHGKSNNAQIGNINYGARVQEIQTQFTQGSVINDDSDTSLAIQGTGFFVVNTPNGEMYTRDGGFSVDTEGKLVTKEGYQVMGENGAIDFGSSYLEKVSKLEVKDNGEISLNGEVVDKLKVVDFEDKLTLKKSADNLYTGEGQPTEFKGTILQGFLEASNVNSVTAMVDMIEVSRAYEANQKVMQVHDSLLGKAVNEVAKG